MILPLLLLVTATQSPDAIRVSWQDENLPWTAEFSKDPAKPLITAIKQGDKLIVALARPFYWIESGKRRGGFDQFFDFPPSHPDGTRKFQSEFKATNPKVITKGDRVEVSFDGLRLGHFSGRIAYTFYPGTRLIQQEAIVSTQEPDTAFYYDAGFEWTADSDRLPGSTMRSEVTYYNTEGRLEQRILNFFASERQPLYTRYRTAAMRTANGSVAAFPAPHQYFMPRDFTSNLAHVWARSFRGQAGLGIRQLPDENWIYYPWMNAPPGTEQRLSLFLQLSTDKPADAIEDVLRYTNRDRFPSLPGYKTLAPHWHFAYTVQAMEYGDQWVPPFKPVLKDMGIDAAIIADFHGDGHPNDTGSVRLKEQEAYFRATKAQSDDKFLIIPGEEADVHLGGHWIGVFPKPVYWYLSRKAPEPFVEASSQYGKVYRVGDRADMLELIRRENGLVYTAHPRTKGSVGFPDQYKNEEFFKDEHFLGAGFKAMPSDLDPAPELARAESARRHEQLGIAQTADRRSGHVPGRFHARAVRPHERELREARPASRLGSLRRSVGARPPRRLLRVAGHCAASHRQDYAQFRDSRSAMDVSFSLRRRRNRFGDSPDSPEPDRRPRQPDVHLEAGSFSRQMGAA